MHDVQFGNVTHQCESYGSDVVDEYLKSISDTPMFMEEWACNVPSRFKLGGVDSAVVVYNYYRNELVTIGAPQLRTVITSMSGVFGSMFEVRNAEELVEMFMDAAYRPVISRELLAQVSPFGSPRIGTDVIAIRAEGAVLHLTCATIDKCA